MSKSRVTTRDRGANKLKKAVAGADGKVLKVGLFGDAAAQKAVGGDGISVADLGTAHEFGLGNVPERSFIRAYVDTNRARVAAMMKRGAESVAKGTHSAEQVLDLLGFKIVGEIQSRMADGIDPPLSPRYLKRKLLKHPGATKPLIATGQLRSAITHSVVKGGEVSK